VYVADGMVRDIFSMVVLLAHLMVSPSGTAPAVWPHTMKCVAGSSAGARNRVHMIKESRFEDDQS
jgi:hypothetical protein